MELYLVRHAQALDIGEPGVTRDEARPLSPKGEADARRQGEALRALGVVPTHLLTSPLLRARQTAELLGGNHGAWRAHPFAPLAVGGDPDLVLARIAAAPAREALVLVGHEPQLGELFQAVLSGPGHPAIPLGKATIVCLELDHARHEVKLRWVLAPKLTKAFLHLG